MIRTQQLLEQQRQRRLDGKSREFQFQARLIEEGRCSPILARAIWEIAQEAFGQKLDQQVDQLRLGQILFLAVEAHEPAGKPVAACQKVTVRLTLDADKDDFEVRRERGLDAVRRARVLRLCTEAREQGALLSYEDLAFKLLHCGTRTIVRDVAGLRAEGIVVPSRGQQQDIGPGQTHRVQAVEWFLKGWEPQQIAHRLYHSLAAIENYLTTFGRVVFLTNHDCQTDEIAFVLQRSSLLVAAYQQLAKRQKSGTAQRRLNEIVRRAAPRDGAKSPNIPGKKGATR